MFGDWLVARGRHIASYFGSRRRSDPLARLQVIMRQYGAAGVVADEPITVRQLG